ncbi:MAG: hypothetical protein AAB837_02040 [Patescibacteria group bacterium]
MTTISVPIHDRHLEFINSYIKRGFASNKAAVVRRAIDKFAEDDLLASVLRAEQEYREGKVLRGDLREILKKFK